MMLITKMMLMVNYPPTHTHTQTHTHLFLVPCTITTVTGLCTVVVWGQPPCTNGQITGYDLRFYQTNPDSVTPVSNRSDEIFRIVKETDVQSNQRGSALVQVSTTILVAEQEAR